MIDPKEQDRLDALQEDLTQEAIEAKTESPSRVTNRNSIYTLRDIIIKKGQQNKKSDDKST